MKCRWCGEEVVFGERGLCSHCLWLEEKRSEEAAEFQAQEQVKALREYEERKAVERAAYLASLPQCLYCGKKFEPKSTQYYDYCCKKCAVEDLGCDDAEDYKEIRDDAVEVKEKLVFIANHSSYLHGAFPVGLVNKIKKKIIEANDWIENLFANNIDFEEYDTVDEYMDFVEDIYDKFHDVALRYAKAAKVIQRAKDAVTVLENIRDKVPAGKLINQSKLLLSIFILTFLPNLIINGDVFWGTISCITIVFALWRYNLISLPETLARKNSELFENKILATDLAKGFFGFVIIVSIIAEISMTAAMAEIPQIVIILGVVNSILCLFTYFKFVVPWEISWRLNRFLKSYKIRSCIKQLNEIDLGQVEFNELPEMEKQVEQIRRNFPKYPNLHSLRCCIKNNRIFEIECVCPFCNNALVVNDDQLGTQMLCPYCQNELSLSF